MAVSLSVSGCRKPCGGMVQTTPFLFKKNTKITTMETNTKEQKNQKSGCIMGLIIGPILFTLVCVSFCSGPTEEEKAEDRNIDRQLTAKTLSQQFVEEKLTAPASAQFSNSKIKKINDSTYLTKGTIDSQNAYGAMLRGQYECTVLLKTDSTGICTYINIK